MIKKKIKGWLMSSVYRMRQTLLLQNVFSYYRMCALTKRGAMLHVPFKADVQPDCATAAHANINVGVSLTAHLTASCACVRACVCVCVCVHAYYVCVCVCVCVCVELQICLQTARS